MDAIMSMLGGGGGLSFDTSSGTGPTTSGGVTFGAFNAGGMSDVVKLGMIAAAALVVVVLLKRGR